MNCAKGVDRRVRHQLVVEFSLFMHADGEIKKWNVSRTSNRFC